MPDSPKLRQPVPPPFLTHLGGSITDLAEGGEVVLELRPEHCNSRATAHGGVVMTLLDVCMARAARASRRQDGHEDLGVMTIEMKASFMNPGLGPALVARGTCLQHSATMAFCEGEVTDPAGRVVARGSGTFKYVHTRARPVRTDAQTD